MPGAPVLLLGAAFPGNAQSAMDSARGVHGDESALIGGDDLRLLPLDRLIPYQLLRYPIHSRDGVLLVSEGSELTPRLLDALRQRGVNSIWAHREETATRVVFQARGSSAEAPPSRPGVKINLHTVSTRRLDRELIDTVTASMRRQEEPFMVGLPTPGCVPYEESLLTELCRTHEGCVSALQSMVKSVAIRQKETQVATEKFIGSYLGLMTNDLDLFAAAAASPDQGNYPYRHSLHVAMLSMAMGVRAGLDRESMESLALGAMLADIGMLRVPRSIWTQRVPLSVTQRLDIMQHPIYSVDALEGASWIPDDVRFIVYQAHERIGGQGYPRRIPGELTHPLAKIVAIADMYVALVSERPHRPAVLPYKAMETVLMQVRAGWFEASTARLMLETLSLYPVGSYVMLSDRRSAKVVRSTGAAYHRPIVRAWPHRTPPSDETGELIDLRDLPDLHVVQALPAPPA